MLKCGFMDSQEKAHGSVWGETRNVRTHLSVGVLVC